MAPQIDRAADVNSPDDDGLSWSTLDDARDRSRVRPGAMLQAGDRAGQAVVRAVAIDDDGQVHFVMRPGSVEKNRHLLGHRVNHRARRHRRGREFTAGASAA